MDQEEKEMVARAIPQMFEQLSEISDRRPMVAISALVSGLVTMLLIVADGISLETSTRLMKDLAYRFDHLSKATSIEDLEVRSKMMADGELSSNGTITQDHTKSKH